MSGENTLSTLNSMFRYIQEKSASLLPENAVLMKLIPEITEAEKEGRKFLMGVQLTHESGVTFASGGVDALISASNAVYGEVQVDATPMVLLTQISNSVANRMANSKKSFITEGTLRAEAMYNSLARYLEISMLYGRSGLATAASSANASATSTVVTVSAATWSPGIWAGAVGATLQCYNGTTLVSSGADAVFTVTAVNVDNKTFTVSGTATGITALDTAIGSGGRKFYFQGSYGASPNDMIGLDAQIVGGASVYNIDGSTYPLWQGNSQSAGSAALNMATVLAGAGKCVSKGGLNSDAVLLVSAATYANLNADQAALREYDGSYDPKEAENGSEGICYRGPNGKIKVMINNICKEGEAFLFPVKHVKRIGAKDLSFERPGKKDEFFQEIPGYTGYSLRAEAEFTILLERPAQACKFTSIVNS